MTGAVKGAAAVAAAVDKDVAAAEAQEAVEAAAAGAEALDSAEAAALEEAREPGALSPDLIQNGLKRQAAFLWRSVNPPGLSLTKISAAKRRGWNTIFSKQKLKIRRYDYAWF